MVSNIKNLIKTINSADPTDLIGIQFHLAQLQNLIAYDFVHKENSPSGKQAINGRDLTSEEITDYQRNRPEANQKEMDLLKALVSYYQNDLNDLSPFTASGQP